MRAALAIGFVRLLSYLPLPLTHALAAGLGRVTFLFRNSRAVRTLDTNLALCLPELSAAERHELGRATLQESAKAFTELGALWLWPCARIKGLVRAVEGEQHMRRAFQQGRGVILLTPHLGAWEMAGLYAAFNYPITSLYRPPKLAPLEEFTRRGREHCGARLVPTDAGGIRALLQALRHGEVAGILPDQDPSLRGQGDFAPFFGVPAYTMQLVSRLARKTGAPVILTFAERLPRGAGFRLHFLPAPPGIDAADDLTALTALNQGVENCARACLPQYQWAYKRFKTRPPGMDSVYD